jgi:hypothetical protein
MKTLRTLILPVAASLLLMSGGCGSFEPDLPDPVGAQGFVDLGWQKYSEGDMDSALIYFQDAINADVTLPGAYLGAGWTTISRSDYWVIADNYFYMAVQQSAGYAPLVSRSEALVQDTLWTVFECMDPDLPDTVLLPILSMLADSGPVWVGTQIYAIVNADGYPHIPYRFHAMVDNPVAMFHAVNNFSQQNCPVDSIVPDDEGGYWIYLRGTYKNVELGEDNIRTWICAGNVMTYDYFTFDPGALTQETYDAFAGWALLQHARGVNGDPLLGCAAIWALDRSVDTYDFGAGTSHDDVASMNMVQLKGIAAALAYASEDFRFALFCCNSEGYGLDLNVRADDFLFKLMQVIESMITFQG